jgi:glycosyltransferase involved in cell wall biosynthesis
MKIALVHSFYSSRQPSGENQVVVQQAELLQAAGHEVRVIGRSTDDEQTKPLFAARTALRLVTGADKAIAREIEGFEPDVIHIHNLFPNIGSRWISRFSSPKVISLHNYRAFCSSGTFFRGHEECFECPALGAHRAVLHGCYRDSRISTLPVAATRASFRKEVLQQVDAVLTTSEASDLVLRNLLSNTVTTHLLPNPGPDSGSPPQSLQERKGWIAAGRFDVEKGFQQLLAHWPTSHQLTILGDGPLADRLRVDGYKRGIRVEPGVPISSFRELLSTFRGLIFPSVWLEVAPQVVVEALRVGLPVIAYQGNSVARFVQQAQVGLAYSSKEDLQLCLGEIESQYSSFSSSAYNYYVQNLRPEIWTKSVLNLYSRLLDLSAA